AARPARTGLPAPSIGHPFRRSPPRQARPRADACRHARGWRRWPHPCRRPSRRQPSAWFRFGGVLRAGSMRTPLIILRMLAIGEVDEANAAIGVALAELPEGEASASLLRIQNEMFDLGADVATPGEIAGALRIVASQVDRLEREIDAMNEDLAPLTSFILPSGSKAVAALHLARCVVRRAERAAVALNQSEPLNPHLLAYVNRLSDQLFVMA